MDENQNSICKLIDKCSESQRNDSGLCEGGEYGECIRYQKVQELGRLLVNLIKPEEELKMALSGLNPEDYRNYD